MASAIILCYHKVGPAAQEGRNLNLEPSRLDSHVRLFRRRRMPGLLAGDLAGDWHRWNVCFTFDDAYASTLACAPDILERNGYRGSFYAVPSLVGETSSWDGSLARRLANWESLCAAHARGHEIGNHSMTHAHLDQLSAEAQNSEIVLADQALKQHGIDCRSICYPYGGVCGREAVPYPVGLGLEKRIATDQDDRLRLPRVVVAYSDSLPLLIYRIWRRSRASSA